MSEIYELHFAVEPVAWSRPRACGKQFFTPPKMRRAQEQLKWLMRSQFTRFPFETPLRVEIVFTLMRPKGAPKARQFPSVRPDCDNYAKLVLDSGNEILWKDDALIVDLRVRKEYGEPGIKLLLEKVKP